MQNKRRIALVCLLTIGALSMGCSLGSLPSLFATPTPTITSTPSPTATQTPSPTKTPIPILDLSSTLITADDLPAGFEPIETDAGTPAEGTIDFAYMNINNFETVTGSCVYLLTDTDRTGFRASINNPTTMLEYIFSDSGNSVSVNEEIPTDGIGHLSSGLMASGTMDGIDFDSFTVQFQRGDVGCLVFVMRLMDQGGTVSVVDLARLWDERLAVFYP